MWRIQFEGVQWIEVIQLKVQWWAFVKISMNVGFCENKEYLNQLRDCQLHKEDNVLCT
jgi:hypothetical protein